MITFFDLDHTLADGDTDFSYLRFLAERGVIAPSIAERTFALDASYLAGGALGDDYHELLRDAFRGQSESELVALAEEHVEARVRAMLFPGAQPLIDGERAQGREVALLSTTNHIVTRPIARALGLDACLSTVLAVSDGELTGELVGDLCHGPGKAARLADHCARRGVDPSDCRMFADGRSDMEALELVGEPVAVHAHERLAARAAEQGWPSIRLDEPCIRLDNQPHFPGGAPTVWGL